MGWKYPDNQFRQESNVLDYVTLPAEVPCTRVSVKQVNKSCWN